jgi:HlyD family secretion protein
MKKLIILLLILVAAGAGGWAYVLRRGNPEPVATTMPFSRGDVVQSVGATGTLEAVETVDVGTQVSGVVQELHADFNDIVKRGQVIARLDPQLIQTQIEQQSANVTRAQADLERLRVARDDARQKLDRAKQMSAKQLIPQTDLETAEVNVKSADAQIRSSEAALVQAQAQLNNQKVNLGYTTITAPIDGIVISRNVDQGQTVAASMNAPTLYVIAADLTKMQVIANIDEADVGNMRPGQVVTFRVDAYPTDTFRGNVSQVRLQPAVVQNVVTYSTVISVPNPELKLKPGMTANVTIEVARKDNVLRIPNRALGFRPTTDMFAALDQPVPPEMERGRGGFGGRRGEGQGGGGQPGAGQPGGGQPGGAQPGGAQPGAGAPVAAAGAQPGAAQPQRQASSQAGAREPRANSGEARGGGSTGAPQPGAQVGTEARGSGQGFGGRGQGRGGFDPNMSDEERQRRREERLKNMTPEERAAFEARMREGRGRGGPGGGFGGNPEGGAGGNRQGAPQMGGNRAGAPDAGNRMGGRQNAGDTPVPGSIQARQASSGATTIDSLFAPIRVQEHGGTAWLYQNKQLKMLRLRLGVTDGTFTEVVNESDIPASTEVVVNFVTGLEPKTTPGQQNQGNPLMGPQRGGPGGRGPGGGGGGGGGGRGRG